MAVYDGTQHLLNGCVLPVTGWARLGLDVMAMASNRSRLWTRCG